MSATTATMTPEADAILQTWEALSKWQKTQVFLMLLWCAVWSVSFLLQK